MHYSYLDDVYNGLYTVERAQAFCGVKAVDTPNYMATYAKSDVTCQACLDAVAR